LKQLEPYGLSESTNGFLGSDINERM